MIVELANSENRNITISDREKYNNIVTTNVVEIVSIGENRVSFK